MGGGSAWVGYWGADQGEKICSKMGTGVQRMITAVREGQVDDALREDPGRDGG